MFARVASFEGGDMERLRELNEEQIESGTLELPPGIRRAMVLAGGDGGGRLFVTFFDSREAIEAAEQRFESMGGEIPEDVRGRRTSVDVYELIWERDYP
jgi:hypothetical protein